MVCSITENSALCVSVLVRHTCRYNSIGLGHHLSSEALQTYSRKPDCFRKAARAISTQCTDLDMDEDARVNGNNMAVPLFQKSNHRFDSAAAISMTLCEIATAKHYSLPLECRSFSLDNPQDRVHKSHQTQGDCVE